MEPERSDNQTERPDKQAGPEDPGGKHAANGSISVARYQAAENREAVRISDEQWGDMERCLPKHPSGGRGRSRIADRICCQGVLWVLFHGVAWGHLPSGYPSGSTCKQRLGFWIRTGVWLEIWSRYVGSLDEAALEEWKLATGIWFRPQPRPSDGLRVPNEAVGSPEKTWRQQAAAYLWSLGEDAPGGGERPNPADPSHLTIEST